MVVHMYLYKIMNNQHYIDAPFSSFGNTYPLSFDFQFFFAILKQTHKYTLEKSRFFSYISF